jgi:RHS repeat-associated protein
MRNDHLPLSVALITAIGWTVHLSGSAAAQAPKTGVGPAAISLPKGPGSVSGLGEMFSPDLNTGGMTYRVPLKLPAGVGGLTPDLALSYASGAGNSEVGFGWSLGLAKIQRRTEKGLPRYDDTDLYVLSGAANGELVPLADGFYRLQIEGSYVRAVKGLASWEVRDKSGRIYRFGAVAEARVEDGERVFAWYLTDLYDTLGNHVEYIYERHGGRPYLRFIRYNDLGVDALTEVELSYEARPDALASFRSGFAVTEGQRLNGITARVGGELHAQYALEYAAASALSRLSKVTLTGSDGVTALPSLTLGYHGFAPDAGALTTMDTPPGVSPADGNNALADLNGDGFPDLLVTAAGEYACYLNDGGTGWYARQDLAVSPSVALAASGVQLADVDGDGRIDLLARLGTGAGDFRYFPAAADLGFGAAVTLTNDPGFSFEDPDVRLLDVTGDGRADVIRTAPGEILFYQNLGGGSYADGVVLPEIDTTLDVRFSDGQHVKLADLNGDGLVDVAYLRSESLVYWPQVGYGRFGAAVEVSGVPAQPDLAWVEFRDLNGDGLADLVRVGVDQVDYWLNQGNGSLGAGQVIADTPFRDPTTTVVQFGDLNGNGSEDIVWIDLSGDPAEAWRYLDVMGSNRPGLLATADNGLGKVIRAEYTSSGALSAAARQAGDPWTIELPVPTQVVARITTSDSLGADRVTELTYRDGHWNGAEREFRGFGQAEQREIGDAHTPTLISAVTFDVGWEEPSRKGLVVRKEARETGGKVYRVESSVYEVVTLATGTDGRQVRAARKASQEVSVVEGTASPRVLLTELEWDDYGNPIAKSEWGEVVAGDPTAGDDERITVTEYAVNEEDWILDKMTTRQLRSASGDVLRWQRFYYDGADHEGLPLGEVTRGQLKRQEAYLGVAEDRWVQEKRLGHDEWGNVVSMLDARGYERRLVYDDVSHRFPVEERLLLDDREIVMLARYDQILGTLIGYTEPNGHETTYQWDALGRLAATVEPGDSAAYPTTEHVYELGAPISAVWTRRRVTSGEPDVLEEVTYHDGLGQVRSRRQRAEDGQFVESLAQVFDARGQKAITYRPRFVDGIAYGPPDPAEERVEEFRDALGRVIRKVLPDGAESRTEFVPLGTWEHDENDTDPASPHFDTPTLKETDGLGRTLRVTEDLGAGERATRQFTWDPADALRVFTDAEGHTRSYGFDALGRRIRTEDADAGTWGYGFDDAGNETRRVDPLGQEIRWTYDGGGRVLTETHGDITYATYHYDAPWDGVPGLGNAVGRLGWVEAAVGIHAFGYDAQGRRTTAVRQVNGQTYTTKQAFDAADRLLTTEYPDGTKLGYQYNERSLVKQAGGLITSQTFGANAELLERRFGNGVITARTYDARIRLKSIQSTGPLGDRLQDFGYGYDRSGNVTRIDDLRPGLEPERDQRVTATYDALDRLVRAEGSGYDLEWTHSPSGNLRTVSGTITPEVKQFVFGQFVYGEGAGPHALTRVDLPGGGSQVYRYDDAGNLTGMPGHTLRYDAKQQVKAVEGEDGELVESVYDHAGNRALRTVTRADGTVDEALYGDATWEVRNGELVKYVVLGGERVARIGNAGTAQEERPASGETSGTAAAALLVLVLLLRQGRSERRVRVLVTASGVVLVLWSCHGKDEPPGDLDKWPAGAVAILPDHLGSWHLLVNAQGVVVSEQASLPYGVERYSSGHVSARYGYTGKEREAGSGLVAIGARHLVVGVGRWNRPDPKYAHEPNAVVNSARQSSGYQYCNGNPLTLMDPDGQEPFPGARSLLQAFFNVEHQSRYLSNTMGRFSGNCGTDLLNFLTKFGLGPTYHGKPSSLNAYNRQDHHGWSSYTMSGRAYQNPERAMAARSDYAFRDAYSRKWFWVVRDPMGGGSRTLYEIKTGMILHYYGGIDRSSGGSGSHAAQLRPV